MLSHTLDNVLFERKKRKPAEESTVAMQAALSLEAPPQMARPSVSGLFFCLFCLLVLLMLPHALLLYFNL